MSLNLERGAAAGIEQRPTTRRADIQGLRAIAVLLVVIYHAGLPLPGGFVGVDVFFVISGFVITAMLMREWADQGRVRFKRFYLRRFLRLTPALALMVTVVAGVSLLLQNPFGAQQTTARTGLGAMLLVANYVIAGATGDYFAADATSNPLLHTWSLSVEEQFYLVFPALFVLGWTLSRVLRRRLWPPVILVSLIGGVSFALSVAWTYGSPFADWLTSFFGGPQTLAFYSSFTRAWEFAVGALLALLLTRLPRLPKWTAVAVGVVGALIIGASAVLINDSMAFPGVLAGVPVVGTALVLLAGSWHTVGVSRALSTRPMVAIGDASYSWYLWHWPIIVFAALLFPRQPVALVVAAALSYVPAALSYRFVEQPLRRLRPRRPEDAGLIVITTVGVPLVLCTALLAGSTLGWGVAPPSAFGTLTVSVVDHAPAAAPTGGQPFGAQPAGERASVSPPAGEQPTPERTASAAPEDPAQAQARAEQDGDVSGGDGGSLRSQHIAVRNDCVNTDLDPDACRFGPAQPLGTVLLAGDSQAYAVADGVVAAAEGIGYSTIVTSHTGCPFLARESSGVHNYPCRAWQKSIVAYALKSRPSAVLIANRSAGYVHPEWGWRTAATDKGGMAGSVREATNLWRVGLEPIVAELSKAGIPVIILGAVPEMRGYTNATSLVSTAFGNRDFDVPRAEALQVRQPALDVEHQLAKTYPTTWVYDPFSALCDGDSCWAVRDDQIRYQDEDHLTVDGAKLLSAGLAEAIRVAVATDTSSLHQAASTGVSPFAAGSPPPLQ
jgi:peptidoglycan/LPS O-acetylase OafA/YrhL